MLSLPFSLSRESESDGESSKVERSFALLPSFGSILLFGLSFFSWRKGTVHYTSLRASEAHVIRLSLLSLPFIPLLITFKPDCFQGIQRVIST